MKHVFFIIVAVVIGFTSCQQEDTPAPNNSSNSGNSPWDFKSLGGSTWVLTAYHDTVSAQLFYPNDTLVFTNSTHYTYNGVPCTYSYYYYTGDGMTHLILNNSPFGDLFGMVPANFETYGQINGIRFGTTTGEYYMWFERI